jgi:hypothetical protein
MDSNRVLCVKRDQYDVDMLRKALQDQAVADVVGLLFVPPQVPPDVKKDLVIAALINGVPYAFWLETDGVDVNAIEQTLSNVLGAAGIDGVPRKVRELRLKATDCTSSLSLMWDNPSHSPPMSVLAAP